MKSVFTCLFLCLYSFFAYSVKEMEKPTELDEIMALVELDYDTYKDKRERYDSFDKAEAYLQDRRDSLVEAGFFYYEKGQTICYRCYVILQDWQDLDNAFEWHARFSPTCSYIKKEKGRDYIETMVRSRHTHIEAIKQKRENPPLVIVDQYF
ncbi:hypothetical protein CI610_02917 [invertebrate metagenome]|uniref:Uncharacterized protein n=1 Tax=invertebrate metagenome TaxID=1711999 RepID=A0A2H9T4M9_9ZZZZ